MSRAVKAEVPKAPKRINRRLAFGVAAAPAAWLLFDVVAFTILGRNCDAAKGLALWQWLTFSILVLLCLGIALAGTFTSVKLFRSRRDGARITRAEGWDKIEFVALFGIFTSLLLILNMVYFSVLPVVLNPCVRGI